MIPLVWNVQSSEIYKGKTDSQLLRNGGRGDGEMGVIVNFIFLGDKNVLKLLVAKFVHIWIKTIELETLNEWNAWSINYISNRTSFKKSRFITT